MEALFRDKKIRRAIVSIVAIVVLPVISYLGYYKYHEGYILVPFKEQCSHSRGYIKSDLSGLQSKLKELVHGQDIAVKFLGKHVDKHLKETPVKPLALIFHGGTGTGKNFVSEIIARHMFGEGLASKYVQRWHAQKDFPDPSKTALYKERIMTEIEARTADCPHQLYIFDEVSQMEEKILDSLEHYLGYTVEGHGADYTKAVYLFLSNAGGDYINNVTFKHHKSGRTRDKLKMKDFDTEQLQLSVASTGGFKNSVILRSGITCVPFLPLESEQIRNCVTDSYDRKNITIVKYFERIAQTVIKNIPRIKKFGNLYAQYGCKNLDRHTNDAVDELQEESHTED